MMVDNSDNNKYKDEEPSLFQLLKQGNDRYNERYTLFKTPMNPY
jgi:hypothetical protein